MHVPVKLFPVVFLVVVVVVASPLQAQWWDFPAEAAAAIHAGSEAKLKFAFESRERFETRTANAFGKDPDISTGLVRTRVGLSYTPFPWLKLSGMLQDIRAPFYGPKAPTTLRDPADLHEAYFEIRPDRKTGFGMTAGRRMLNYGEGRLIGTPQWSNISRTYDHTRVYYQFAKARYEFLVVSPVKILPDDFNRPVLGDRVWGTYDIFSGLFHRSALEVYILRHDQNRPGGFTGGSKAAGTDRLEVNTFGGRLTGPLGKTLAYNLELALQNGTVGPARHRAGALDSWIKHRWDVAHRPLDVQAEYKFASGTKDPANTLHRATFDQLYPANHDKFGHEDLFGWRNIHDVRSLTTYPITKSLTVNFMYDSLWLATARDSLYNGSGSAILRSPNGTAGRHVGEEADLFATYSYLHFMLGAGYGHLFAGGFVRQTSPGASPTYLYLFHTYSF